jgi:hypothetical protein
MKHFILSVSLLWICIASAFGQFADPAVSGANFVPNEVTVGQSATLTISFANTGSTPIPQGAIELTISTAKDYYSSNGTTAPGGTGAALFNWTYLGSDVWRGTNSVAVPAFGGGPITLAVNGLAQSPAFETTNVNVQPVSNFGAFNDAATNNNLQPKLKVNPAAATPVANNDSATTPFNTAVNISPLTNDNLNGGTNPVLAVVAQPANGTVSVSGNQFVFTPTTGFSGTTTFTYNITASNGTSNTATVTVTVGAPPPAPVANNDSATTPFNTAVNISPLGNDNLNGGTNPVLSVVAQPANGSVSVSGNQFVFTPTTGFTGTTTFTYRITASNGTSNTATVTVTVGAAPVLPSISIADVAVNENAGNATITLTLSAPSATPVTVQYSTANGTAQSGSDYTTASGTATFAANSTTTTFPVAILDDNVNEPTETFNVNLTSPSGATIADNQGVVTINDNDQAGGTPDCANITITAGNGSITVTALNGAPVSSLQVFTSTWQQVFNCFANCGASQTVNVPAGSYFVFAKYYTAGYALICEKQLTVTVGGNDPCAGLGGDTDGDGTCNNNDCQPNNPAFPATPGTACNDNNPNTTNDVVTANGCGCAGTPVDPCANLGGDTDGDGTCNNNDCQPNNPAFPATPGSPCNDNNPNTTNDVVTANGCGCAGTPVAQQPSISIADVAVNENVGNATITLTLSAPSATPVTVQYATANGTALSGSDYTTRTGTATFAANATTTTFTVAILDDNVNEPTEAFNVNLTSPSGATIADNQGVVTINDNDQAGGTPNCANIIIMPGAGTITVTGLGGAPISSLQVFSSTWQQIYNCFANCGASQTVNVPAGTYYVYAKYFTAGYALICEKQQTVTVGGSGGQPTIAINDVTVNENAGTATFTVTLSAPSASPVTVAYSTANGTATAPGDYTTKTATLTIPAGSTTGAIQVQITDDNVNEPTETFSVNLSSPTGATIADSQGIGTINDNDPAAPICDNVTNGGIIGFGTSCATSAVHCLGSGACETITNCGMPTGGTGALEVMWLRSTTSCAAPTSTAAQVMAGLDPHWRVIPGITSLSFSPGTVVETTCYLRCVRRAGCGNFIESNIISLIVDPNCNSNGTPNCANVTITPGNGNITVGGLNGAPVVSVQVFNAGWQQLHNCFGNCGNTTATFPVPAGAYVVYVKYYTANYQLVCEVNQNVNVATNLVDSSDDSFRFEAIKHSEHTELLWSHKGDYLVDEYIVERSVDGISFEELSFQGSDKDANAVVYNDYDLEPLTGDNYYRIKLLNADGSFSYSEAKLVRFEDLVDFQVFPNPANSFTSINLEKVMGKQVDIHIFNDKGLRMKTFHVDEVSGKYFQMDLRDLHEGHYIIWVNVPGKRPIAKTLVIGRI